MDAKRGYVPEDDKNFSPDEIAKLKTASRHVNYLINEGYDIKQATTFVGNHFILSERQRLAIARSLSTTEQLNNRKAKEKTSAEGCELWIDGFNTIITLEVMFSNSILYRGMDGTIRDLAALRGTYKIIPETTDAIKLLLDVLSEMKVESVIKCRVLTLRRMLWHNLNCLLRLQSLKTSSIRGDGPDTTRHV